VLLRNGKQACQIRLQARTEVWLLKKRTVQAGQQAEKQRKSTGKAL